MQFKSTKRINTATNTQVNDCTCDINTHRAKEIHKQRDNHEQRITQTHQVRHREDTDLLSSLA